MIFCFVILVLASASAKNFQAAVEVKHEVHKETYVAADSVYHGEYKGKCGNDGFYYNDESSIVICSNGNAHIQPCAPGSKNSAKEQYQQGTPYVYRDFCDINLVDDGYTLTHGHATNPKNDYSPKKVVLKVHVAPKIEVKVAEPKVYVGKYEGKCGNDGFYYNDESSIVICSNGNAHIQPCAPGSKNSARVQYQQGTPYVYRDFCDVNLVDDGYALKHGYAVSSKSVYSPPMEVKKIHAVPKAEPKAEPKVYIGKYEGKCGNDGFYYNDESSIVICSNGNAHIQPCAPGSKNSAKEQYQHGTPYVYRDFCDINLVDDGYTLDHGYAASSKSDYSSQKMVPKVYVAPKVAVKVVEPKVYVGKYEGKCGNDGFYYNDESSIVICSNGNAHIQPCAPGSKNSARVQYQQGTPYVYRDFCDVNLVNDGYAIKHGSYSDMPHQKEYGMPDAYAYHGAYDFFGNAHVYHPAPVNYGW